MSGIPSYPKIAQVGNKYIADLFNDEVVIQEKVDGSQFSFMASSEHGLLIRSKGAVIYPETADALFKKAVAWAVANADFLVIDWVYRGEAVSKPKHNTLCYDRSPDAGFILFDVEKGVGTNDYASPAELLEIADELGIECVPTLYQGTWKAEDRADLQKFFDTVSVLGGAKIEGVVVKNYHRPALDGKLLVGKLVCADFKELHTGEWKKSNPSKGDRIEKVIEAVRTPARWRKAVQHLAERGELAGSPSDIGGLMKEVQLDLQDEAINDIKDMLWEAYRKDILRGATHGLPEWYKESLLIEGA